MWRLWLAVLTTAGMLSGWNAPEGGNVNSRYVVDAVAVAPTAVARLSPALRKELERMIGQPVDQAEVVRLARRVREELRALRVTPRLARGISAQSLRVILEVEGPPGPWSSRVSQLSYQSGLGWTLAAGVSGTAGNSEVGASVRRDAEIFLEPVSGVHAFYQRARVGSAKLRLRVDLDAVSPDLQLTASASPITPLLLSSVGFQSPARLSRTQIEPALALAVTPHLTVAAGFTLQSFRTPAAGEASQAARGFLAEASWKQRWAPADGDAQWLEARYRLRTASALLGSTQGFQKHGVQLRYGWQSGPWSVRGHAGLGWLNGRAPLYESLWFNTDTVLRSGGRRDWAALDATRLATAGVDARWRRLLVLYDAGSLWGKGQTRVLRQSVGLGLRVEGITLALAVPVREGPVVPVFMAGLQF